MDENKPGAFKRFWNMLKRPSAKYSFIAIAGTSFVAGIIFWGGFNTGMEMTNTLGFCVT